MRRFTILSVLLAVIATMSFMGSDCNSGDQAKPVAAASHGHDSVHIATVLQSPPSAFWTSSVLTYNDGGNPFQLLAYSSTINLSTQMPGGYLNPVTTGNLSAVVMLANAPANLAVDANTLFNNNPKTIRVAANMIYTAVPMWRADANHAWQYVPAQVTPIVDNGNKTLPASIMSCWPGGGAMPPASAIEITMQDNQPVNLEKSAESTSPSAVPQKKD